MIGASTQPTTEYQVLAAEHEALQTAHRQLQQTDHLHQELVGMLVHDLKTPLAVILASLDLLADELDEHLGNDLRDVFRVARRSGQGMLQIITNLLEVQRLEAGQMPFQPQPLDVAVVLQETMAQAGYLAQQKGVDLSLHVPNRLPWAWADLDLTERVVANLLDNAIRFTPGGAKVVVTGQAQQRHLTISVADGGPGIPTEQQAHVFDKFAQFGSALQSRKASVGLGLAFCRLAVEAQRGNIWVESAPGAGARFSFTLPAWRGAGAGGD